MNEPQSTALPEKAQEPDEYEAVQELYQSIHTEELLKAEERTIRRFRSELSERGLQHVLEDFDEHRRRALGLDDALGEKIAQEGGDPC